MTFLSRLLAIPAALVLALMPVAAGAQDGTAHQFTFTAIEGGPMPMDQYAGKAVLVVNTASLCGFTPQYTGLQALYDGYRDKGLVVVGVPSNDFGQQEPGTEADIKEFCEVNYDITFPMTEKEVVSGAKAHPFYRWAGETLGGQGKPRWNFHKILIAPDGRAVAGFPSTTRPESPEITTAIEQVLPTS